MRLIFIGPPGSGKGTQAKLLCARMGLVHFSTGDILRDAVKLNAPEVLRAKVYMDAGQLVPDDLVNAIVRARFHAKDKPERFVMDGYPRTFSQALAFDGVLKAEGLALSAVVFLNVQDDEIVGRLSARWTCANASCKAIYHLASKPPKVAHTCDLCQGPLYQREDDRPDIIHDRLCVFHNQHDAILGHYQKQGLLIEVAGVGDVETIHAEIVRSLHAKRSK